MIMADIDIGKRYWLAKPAFQNLLDALRELGYQVVGPTIRDEAIIYGPIERVAELPIGWWDDQEGGRYRLRQAPTDAWFEFVVGPQSLKHYTFPPRQTVLEGNQQADGQWKLTAIKPESPPTAILGVRACDLAALVIQDRVFLGSQYRDESFAARRERLFLVAANCQRAAPTCFCKSMNCGPRVTQAFDMALTEGADGFVVEVGSAAGAAVAERLPLKLASQSQVTQVEQRLAALIEQMSQGSESQTSAEPDSAHHNGCRSQRQLDTAGLRDLLFGNLNHPHWDEVASRCLSCGNCTMVCPTCFCSTVEEVPLLDDSQVLRERVWASCFTSEHSYMASGVVRQTTRSRYRQWLTHKLAGWIDQFGVSGCVGCGRCITWCPVGIDITAEVAALRSPQEIDRSNGHE